MTITAEQQEMRRMLRRHRNRNNGVVAGVFGCAFGLLGMFTIGLIFAPLAALKHTAKAGRSRAR